MEEKFWRYSDAQIEMERPTGSIRRGYNWQMCIRSYDKRPKEKHRWI